MEAVKVEERKDTLLSLAHEYREIEKSLFESGGEITSVDETQMKEIETKLLSKVDACAYVIERLSVDADYFKTKAAQWIHAAKAYENAAKRLKDRVKYTMREMQLASLEGDDQQFKLTGGRTRIVIDDKILPKEFWEEVITTQPNRELVETALQNGIDVAGCKIEEIFSLRIATKKKDKKS